MTNKKLREDALNYHSQGRPGKIEVLPTKPYNSQHDLSLAYTPGVAEPCLEIEKNPSAAYSRSEEHTSELQSPVAISYAVFCLKKNFF